LFLSDKNAVLYYMNRSDCALCSTDYTEHVHVAYTKYRTLKETKILPAHRQTDELTRKLCYSKDDRAMRSI